MAKISHSNNWTQSQLQQLSKDILDNFDRVIQHFDLDLSRGHKCYSGPCPVHGGDRFNALNLYHTGNDWQGNWRCNTAQCHDTFVASPVGFIWGVLSHREKNWEGPGDDIIPFLDAVNWSVKFVGKKGNDFESLYANNKDVTGFIREVKAHNPTEIVFPRLAPRERVRQALQIPAQEYLDRGYSLQVINRHDVGLCTTSNKKMSDRIVFPCYDDTGKWMIGCIGRSVWKQCIKCRKWHNPEDNCPTTKDRKWAKWVNSDNFRTSHWLYNWHRAKDHILQNGIIILVEGPGDVLRLEDAGIPYGVALFGAALSPGQERMIDKSGAMTLIVTMDSDEAGQKATNNIVSSMESKYNVIVPRWDSEQDIGDMYNDELHSLLDKIIERYKI